MLIRTCAWHRRTFGLPALMGVKRDGRWAWTTTHGCCRECANAQRRRLGLAVSPPSFGAELFRAVVACGVFLVYAGLALWWAAYAFGDQVWATLAR